MNPLLVIETLALAILLTASLVAARFLLCFHASLCARRYLISVVSIIGFLGIVASLGLVIIAWFAYAVAHTGKDAGTDLRMLLITVPPFFLISVAFWLLGGNLRSRLRSNSPGKEPDRRN